MGDLPVFEIFRDLAFKGILSDAFKSFPKRVEQILERESWEHFTDFMAAVERSGKVLFQFEGKPSAKTIEKLGLDAALKQMWGIANTNAMHHLLSEAFFGNQEGDVDRGLSRKALFPMGITTWHTFSMAVLEQALLFYAVATGGETPEDTAQPVTLLFRRLTETATPEIMYQVIKAFGLSSEQHLAALSSAFWSGDLTVEDLDRSIGDPDLLTQLVNRSPSNPHKGIVFSAVESSPSMGYAEAFL